eukprot:CAMPEP_0197022200 /NCGR_PEP_ID=MMETSP1384-20130603/3101_1 /TAXON_ID=29189 /ORGANISM="Ammonia sp." /LENGTH=47 /DNA_ID= /DNA_START= /DNA_END= /DNA_ORIENTATION=
MARAELIRSVVDCDVVANAGDSVDGQYQYYKYVLCHKEMPRRSHGLD